MQIIIWYNEKKNDYYYKTVHSYNYKKYFKGFKNQYEHEVVLVIENIYLEKPKINIKKRVITKIISFLQKIDK